jgi:large subunit ribosomal protein L6e
VELKGIDEKVVEKVAGEGYFTRDKAENKKGEDQFFSQGEKPEVRSICEAFTGKGLEFTC